MAAAKKRPVPKPRPAPFNPSKVKPAGPKNPIKGKAMGSDPRSDRSGVVGPAFGKPKPRTGVSGATYTPGKGTRVTPNARPKGKR